MVTQRKEERKDIPQECGDKRPPSREPTEGRGPGEHPYKNRGRMHVATKSILVVIIAMLTASLAILQGAEGFEAYDCSNFSNPRRCTYS